MSPIEAELALHLRAYRLDYVREYRFTAEHVGMGKGVKDRLKEAGPALQML